MCIEVYSDNPIDIEFESEFIAFDSPSSFNANVTLLVRNVGNSAIEFLRLLYPRSLFSEPSRDDTEVGMGSVQPKGVVDVTKELLNEKSGFFDSVEFDRDSKTLHAVTPSPNNPDTDLHLVGSLFENNSSIFLPNSYSNEFVELMRYYGFTAWYVQLEKPIAEGDAQWFSWNLSLTGVGESVHNPYGGSTTYHGLASPILVHHTIKEYFLTGMASFDHEDEWSQTYYPAHEYLINDLKLREERNVNLKYYLLHLNAGDPAKQLIRIVSSDGDLVMIGDSPKLQKINGLHIPVFCWKSGTMLRPAHPFVDVGFALKFTLESNSQPINHSD